MSIRIETTPFDPGAETNRFLAQSEGAGAAVTFTGLVRSEPGAPVSTLTLETYPELAIAQIGRAIAEATSRFGLLAATVIHRHGTLAAGEPIVQVMTLAPHRHAAFEGAEFLMDYLKTDAPFWKKESTPVGAHWVEARAEDDHARARWTAAPKGTLSDTDRQHLARAVDLAEQSLEGGNDPFGTLLVSADGEILFEARNEVSSGDATAHPELIVAQWAARNLTPGARRDATVYTSGEHCPMCAAAHGWVGLGRIVYASSSAQLTRWLSDLGLPPTPVNILPIEALLPGTPVDGPEASLSVRLRELHRRRAGIKSSR